MVLNNLRKTVEFYRQQLDSISNPSLQQFELLKGLPFYNWQNPNDTNTFNHAIGLPIKDGKRFQLFDYELTLYQVLQQYRHVWIKKSTGLEITEFILRYMV